MNEKEQFDILKKIYYTALQLQNEGRNIPTEYGGIGFSTPITGNSNYSTEILQNAANTLRFGTIIEYELLNVITVGCYLSHVGEAEIEEYESWLMSGCSAGDAEIILKTLQDHFISDDVRAGRISLSKASALKDI